MKFLSEYRYKRSVRWSVAGLGSFPFINKLRRMSKEEEESYSIAEGDNLENILGELSLEGQISLKINVKVFVGMLNKIKWFSAWLDVSRCLTCRLSLTFCTHYKVIAVSVSHSMGAKREEHKSRTEFFHTYSATVLVANEHRSAEEEEERPGKADWGDEKWIGATWKERSRRRGRSRAINLPRSFADWTQGDGMHVK